MAKEEKPTHANSPEWAKVKIASRRESMDHFKYDELPSVLLKAEAEDGQSIADRELKRLDGLGFRGVRFNFMKHLGAGAKIEDVIGLTQRLAPLGWHLQVHFDSSLIGELAPWLRKSAVPVVIVA